MTCRDVLRVAYADVRHPQDSRFERVTGIQREPNPSRVREIQKYVRTVDATFPTSVILAIDGKNAKIDNSRTQLSIRDDQEVALILDGQHRLAGLEGFDGEFDLNVVVFVDMDIQDQAMTFGTINLAQTKVNKSLVFDLYEFQKKRSPYKTCHTIARLLNREPKSPLSGRIKMLGKAVEGEELQLITQATFVNELVRYISSDPLSDRDVVLQGETPEEAAGAAANRQLFREFWREDRDEEIVRIVWDYFDVVSAKWSEAWDANDQGMILNRTTGFTALMRFLGPVYRHGKNVDGKLPKSAIKQVFDRVKIKSSEFTSKNYLPGSEGVSRLLKDLKEKSQVD
jgi:DGQHR domain-containing protein